MAMGPLQNYLDEFFSWLNNAKILSVTWNLGKAAAAVSIAVRNKNLESIFDLQ